nr:hypothetical protein CFP56_14246 [Quercus suber]
MRSILLQLCRSEKDDSDRGSDDRIGAILVACEAYGRFSQIFDRHVAARGGSDVEDPTEAVILVAVIELLAVKIQPCVPLTAMERSGEDTEKVY